MQRNVELRVEKNTQRSQEIVSCSTRQNFVSVWKCVHMDTSCVHTFFFSTLTSNVADKLAKIQVTTHLRHKPFPWTMPLNNREKRMAEFCMQSWN